jgi:hypothetical protein
MSVCLFCVCVVLCEGRGLAIGSFPVQGVLPTVYGIKKLKKLPTEGCGAIIIYNININMSTCSCCYQILSFICACCYQILYLCFTQPLWSCLTYPVCRWLPTAVAQVRAESGHVGYFGGQSGTGEGFLQAFRFPLPIIPPIAPHSSFYIIRGWYNRPNSSRHSRWTQSHPFPRN